MGRLFAGVLAVVAALVVVAPAAAFTRTDQQLPMGDGVSLASSLYLPDGAPPAGGWPAVLVLHGLGGTRGSVSDVAERVLAPYGYAVLTVDARGHGESGGQSTLVGARELADYAAALAWLRARPGISDSRIGAIGFSLGGGSVWKLLTAPGARLAAAVPVMTWTSLYDALLPQSFAKAGLVASFRGLLPDHRWDAGVKSLADDALFSRNLPRLQEFARERSVRNDLEKIRTPVFMIQGRRDYAFDMEHALNALGRLKGPRRLYLGDLGHAPATNPAAERAHYLTQARLWFDRFLKGELNGIDTRPRIELAPDPWTGRTTQYPRQPARRVLRLRFRGAKTIDGDGKVVRTVAATRRLNETFGTPLAGIKVASTTRWPHVVAVLSALTPSGQEIVVSQGGTRTPTLSARKRLVTVRLVSQATTIPRGSRLRLTIAGSSTAQHPDNLLYPLSVPSAARASIGEATLVLPVLRRPISRL
ncbi:MAG TPA: alpha/beta fold hydrolase [Gaiellaceae bacterium]|nr:alpha/beta fold hydrolase [Gaiellaceae bacterium]